MDKGLFIGIFLSDLTKAIKKILGVYFDNKLNFEYHLETLCKKVRQKLHALIRVSSFMSLQQKKIIIIAFITFGYCSIIWMCHSRIKIDKLIKFTKELLTNCLKNQDQLVHITEICSSWLLKSIKPCIICHPLYNA